MNKSIKNFRVKATQTVKDKVAKAEKFLESKQDLPLEIPTDSIFGCPDLFSTPIPHLVESK